MFWRYSPGVDIKQPSSSTLYVAASAQAVLQLVLNLTAAVLLEASGTHLLSFAYWLHGAFLLLGWAACAGFGGLLTLLLTLQRSYLQTGAPWY
jgi:hypothetical protein